MDHSGLAAPLEDQFAQDVRIVLVAPNFSKEITTTVIWLNERALDVRCVRIQPYQLDGRLLLDVQQIIPLPEAAIYQVHLKEKAAEQRASRAQGDGPDFTRYDLRIAGQSYRAQWKRNMILLVVRAAIAQGASRETLPVPRGKWLVVQGNAPDRSSFLEKARAEPNRVVKENRWFLKDEQLLRDATATFALSNQWSGPDVLPAIDQLASRFPELEISYEVSGT